MRMVLELLRLCDDCWTRAWWVRSRRRCDKGGRGWQLFVKDQISFELSSAFHECGIIT